ncbi:MAG: hypothetical protein K8R88_01400, partial [Armatimonadetes bacterium]|nr:hypothetical protein [Armatimonadota bacterium]
TVLSKVEDDFGIGKPLLTEGITDLFDMGILKLIGPDGEELKELPDDITGLAFQGINLVARPVFQPTLPMDPPRTREQSGREEVTLDGDKYRATVTPEPAGTDGHSGRYLLNVARFSEDGDISVVAIEDKSFDYKDTAWEYWDEYKKGLASAPMIMSDQQISDIIAWAETLHDKENPNGGAEPSEVIIDQATFDALKFATQAEPSDKDAKQSWYFDRDASDYIGKDPEGKFWQVQSEESEGQPLHRWPGLDVAVAEVGEAAAPEEVTGDEAVTEPVEPD